MTAETDLISRQAAIDALADMHCKSDELLKQVMERIPEVNGGNEEGHRGLD